MQILRAAVIFALTVIVVKGSDITITVSGKDANRVYCQAQNIVQSMSGPVTIKLPAGHYACASAPITGTLTAPVTGTPYLNGSGILVQ